VLKVELHAHTADDPIDRIPHSTAELINRAADLGYDALAITLHQQQLDLTPWRGLAADRGLLLIPGVERTVEGKHVLLLNFSSKAEQVDTFADLAELRRRERGLVIAPHAFFPASSCLGRELMDRHADLFDVVEYNAMFAAGANFNRAAERWARLHGRPLVGNGDVYRLQQLGSTYSLVDAPAEPDAICEAIRAGRLQIKARPLPWPTTISLLSQLLIAEPLRGLITPNAQRPTPNATEAQLRNEGMPTAIRVRIRSLIGSRKLGVGS
jgi:predicted metal-dependent phosphoesterase TrpH